MSTQTFRDATIPFRILKARTEKGRRLIYGTASIEVVDHQRDLIRMEAFEEALKDLWNAPNLMLQHTSTQIGTILREMEIDGEHYRTEVVGKAFRILAEVRSDIQTANEVWEAILDGTLNALSIGGRILHSLVECASGACYNAIDKLELHEVSVVTAPANPGAFFTVISKALHKALRHGNQVADDEPSWGSIDKTRLPANAYAVVEDPEAKGTWRAPHHWVRDGGGLDDMGVYTTGDMFLHRGGVIAAFAAARGARQQSPPAWGEAAIRHLAPHRRALGIEEAAHPDDWSIEAATIILDRVEKCLRGIGAGEAKQIITESITRARIEGILRKEAGTEIQSIILMKEKFPTIAGAVIWMGKNFDSITEPVETELAYTFTLRALEEFDQATLDAVEIYPGVIAHIGKLLDGQEINYGHPIDENGEYVRMNKENEGTAKGPALASALNRAVDAMVDDDTSRADIVSRMASAAGIASATVNSILAGEINCPPLDRLEGFSQVLGVAASTLRTAAESDGCTYNAKSTQHPRSEVDDTEPEEKMTESKEAPVEQEDGQFVTIDQFKGLEARVGTVEQSIKKSEETILAAISDLKGANAEPEEEPSAQEEAHKESGCGCPGKSSETSADQIERLSKELAEAKRKATEEPRGGIAPRDAGKGDPLEALDDVMFHKGIPQENPRNLKTAAEFLASIGGRA